MNGRDVWVVGDGGTILTKQVPLICDANGDGSTNVVDVPYLIQYLFAGGPPPVGNSDPTGDGAVTIGDVFYLIHSIFSSGPPPV